MSSKRRIRRKACKGKIRHVDEGAARAALRALLRAKGDQPGVMTPYHCAFCGGFHIGHTPGSGRGW